MALMALIILDISGTVAHKEGVVGLQWPRPLLRPARSGHNERVRQHRGGTGLFSFDPDRKPTWPSFALT
jgi:hypothetical protein